MSTPSKTDERLRGWLDTNQLARERLCQAVLALDRRFANVRPRNPRGGRDGGRDLEATFSDGQEAWAAIGFQNSVSDSKEDKKQAKKKFRDDLKRAFEEKSDLKVYVFFCNVALTAGEKNALSKHARQKGIEVVDVFDRERIRIALDSVEGLSIRYQYLDLELSSAEQAAFFGRWGSDIESLITESFDTVGERLARIEFFMERTLPLTRLDFYIQLTEPVSRADLGHFRVDFTMLSDPPAADMRWMHIGVCDDRGVDHPIRGDCYSGAVWSTPLIVPEPAPKTEEKNEVIQTSSGLLEGPVSQIRGSISNEFHTIPIFDHTLGDLEGNSFLFFTTPSIANRVSRVLIVANEYVIFSADLEDLIISKNDYKFEWPLKFTEQELEQPWMRVMYKYDASRFNFSRHTPTRFFRPKTIALPESKKA